MALPLTTDHPDHTIPPEAREVARDFIVSRLGSLFAIAPLGVWVVMHLWHQLAAWRSPAAWQEAVEGHVNGATTVLVFIVVLGPLLWHTVWGIARMLRSRPAVSNRGFSNLRYLLQRLAAIGLLGFLGAHLYLAWFEPRFLHGGPEPFSEIAREMRFHGPTLVVYLLGTLGIAYHLANGLWSFLSMGWGVTVSKSGMAWMERVSLLFFFVLLIIGWAAVYALYAGGEAYGPPA
jgi:succinate dehydrogenase / fumarate reductase, cytochrome b subunit